MGKAIFIRVGIGVLAATVLVVVVALFLPNSYSVTRSVVINAPAARIHTYTGDLTRWPEWTPWLKEDPTIEVTLGDTTTGVGASQTWVGESGGGELTFTRSDPAWGIAYDMAFDRGKYRSRNTMEYQAAGESTEVSWTMTGDHGPNPLERYFGIFMPAMIGPMFDEGLARLKLVSEKAATPDEVVPGG